MDFVFAAQPYLKKLMEETREVETGIICVGVAVKNYKSKIRGAISVSCSIINFNKMKLLNISNLLLKYSKKISEELGYRN